MLDKFEIDYHETCMYSDSTSISRALFHYDSKENSSIKPRYLQHPYP